MNVFIGHMYLYEKISFKMCLGDSQTHKLQLRDKNTAGCYEIGK